MISKYFHRFLSWQFFGLANYLDPPAIPQESATIVPEEVDQQASSSSKWNFYFIPPFIIILLCAIHGNVFLPYTVGVPLTWASLSTSPALLFRQMFPPVMWPQTDIAACIIVPGSLAIYVSFWLHPWTLPRYVIVWATEKRLRPLLRIGNNCLSPDSSLKILKVHRRLRKASFATFIGACLFAGTFIYANFFLNGFYSLTNGHYLISLLLYFPYCIPVLYALFGITTFPILASVCIQIRQKDVISQMSALNDKVNSLKKSKKGKLDRYQRALATFRHTNRHLNRTVLSICSQLEAYATYWTPTLSLLFLIYTTFQTYLVYPVFFIGGIIFFQKICFLNLIIEIDVALFLLINVCARVVAINRRIEVANRDFYLSMARKGAFKGKNICQQLKCEAFAMSHRLRPYAFHLFDNYRITSQTFYMVISNIALLFLLVFKHSV